MPAQSTIVKLTAMTLVQDDDDDDDDSVTTLV